MTGSCPFEKSEDQVGKRKGAGRLARPHYLFASIGYHFSFGNTCLPYASMNFSWFRFTL